MRDDLEEQWRVFSAIEQGVIDHDLALYGGSLEAFLSHPAHKSKPGETAEEKVRQTHGKLILASILNRREGVNPEFRLFQADYAAMQVVQDGQSIAVFKDRLDELQTQMDALREREGATGVVHWPPGEGPKDFQALAAECDALFNRVGDTLLLSILRRYRMEDLANLYENDRRSYDLQREIGRRISVGKRGNRKTTTWFNERIREEYGEAAEQHVITRTAEIRRQEGTAI